MVRLAISAANSSSSQVQRREGERIEVRAGCGVAQIRGHPFAERRHPRAKADGRAVPTEQLPNPPPDRKERADGAGGTLRRVGGGKEPSTNRRKSSEPPVPGKSHTSSSRKSRVSSSMRQGWEVCAVFGSRIVDLIQTRQPNPTSATVGARWIKWPERLAEI